MSQLANLMQMINSKFEADTEWSEEKQAVAAIAFALIPNPSGFKAEMACLYDDGSWLHRWDMPIEGINGFDVLCTAYFQNPAFDAEIDANPESDVTRYLFTRIDWHIPDDVPPT